MARYTILHDKDIRNIIGFYGLTLHSFEALDGGAANSSYLLKSAEGDFVLTVFDSKEWTHVTRLGRLLNYLSRKKFITTKLLPRLDGTYITTYKKFPVMIKHYLHGRVHARLTKKMLRRTGAELARLHQIPPPDYLPAKHSYGRQIFSQVIGKGPDLAYESWLAGKQQYIQAHLPAQIPRGLIHGDLFNDNILFSENELLALIDFEEACNYFLAFDIGMGIVGQCIDGNQISFEKAKEFVSGYQRVRKMKKIGRQTLQLFVEYAAVATSFWRYWNYHITNPTPEKQKTHLQMMQIADHVSAIPAEVFTKALFGFPK